MLDEQSCSIVDFNRNNPIFFDFIINSGICTTSIYKKV